MDEHKGEHNEIFFRNFTTTTNKKSQKNKKTKKRTTVKLIEY